MMKNLVTGARQEALVFNDVEDEMNRALKAEATKPSANRFLCSPDEVTPAHVQESAACSNNDANQAAMASGL